VRKEELEEWAEWICEWLDKFREEHRLGGRRAAQFLDNGPTLCNRAAMQVFREHNVRVIHYPPHLTHVLPPVDICWAKQFNAKLMEAWQWLGKPCAAETAFPELGENILRASPTHHKRFRMVFSICEAAAAVTNLSSASQGFWHAGLAPWGPGTAGVAVHRGWGDSR
jgi:hypothetical protein